VGADEKRRERDDGAQLTFANRRSWGGPRKKAGRKRGPRPKVPHRSRSAHSRWCPVHVTMRRARGLPTLRSELLHRELREAIRKTRREDFRIVVYSVQADHVHLLVEANDAAALAAGMKSFAVRAAMAVNRVLRRRRGHLWGDRHHRRELTAPRDVRNTIVYVMSNHRKHGEHDVGFLDPCSSGPWFTGWMQVLAPPPDPSPVEAARTWLLDWGWHRGRDFIHLGEMPRAARAPRALRESRLGDAAEAG
jgi:REP element-mobilizing transposase RayT